MTNRLADSISPYLRSHAENPVDWWPWCEEAFAEAQERDVPVFVSIGYATCHWCHVMARETFSDERVAAYLNKHFVSIKVDREEHPDVDSSYLASAAAFTPNLGWPLNVFVTPSGRVFYAGTYFPPKPLRGHPSFRNVLETLTKAWKTMRDDVTLSASRIAFTLAGKNELHTSDLPTRDDLRELAATIAEHEDTEHGGFGGAPKFPMVPLLTFLLAPSSGADKKLAELVERSLRSMAVSPLRDRIEGGFFRYATQADWSVPHYERMLYDNAGLVALAAQLRRQIPEFAGWLDDTVTGVASFLTSVMQLPSGAFASAQDSESIVDGERSEGGYYALDAAERTAQPAPALDDKVLTGWNGLAIGALADAAFVFGRAEWAEAAARAADYLLDNHVADDGTLVRASREGVASTAHATLEDYGMFAAGLLRLSLVVGRPSYFVAGKRLVDLLFDTAAGDPDGPPFVTPEGADPVLARRGLVFGVDVDDQAYPSGLSAAADAAHLTYLLTGDDKYLHQAARAVTVVAEQAQKNPGAHGSMLRLATELTVDPVQLVVITRGDVTGSELLATARRFPATVATIMDESVAAQFAEAGCSLLADKTGGDEPVAYLCRDFTCRLPTSDADVLVSDA